MQRAMSIFMVCLLVLATTPGFATSGAHFFNDTSATVDLTNGALRIHIDEGGLGQATTDYTVTGTGSATFQCFNNGGNHPKAGNKATFGAPISFSFASNPLNGRVQETLTASNTPVANAGFSCPGGQDLYLQSVSYSVTITDTTNNASAGPLTTAASSLHLLIP